MDTNVSQVTRVLYLFFEPLNTYMYSRLPLHHLLKDTKRNVYTLI